MKFFDGFFKKYNRINFLDILTDKIPPMLPLDFLILSQQMVRKIVDATSSRKCIANLLDLHIA